jgi:glycosyltransferase involved in cell wall biosynthesis
LKIACINDTTYRSSTPDYENNLSFYGSEPYHAVIAKGLAQKGHEVHWFAPQGSEPIGTYHPTLCMNGYYAENEILDEISLEQPKLTTKWFIDAKIDFILDYSAIVRNIEHIQQYYGFNNYGVFRNGYNGYAVPRLRLKDRHYIVPSNQNQKIFEKHGFTDVATIYYGVPDFYSPHPVVSENKTYDPEYDSFFDNNNIQIKNYFLYPHRPTPEKGSDHIIQLAKMFPDETFVFMVSNNPVPQHKDALSGLKKQSVDLKNVKYVELPLTNKHHYYKRELMRHAKAILSPFNPQVYLEGFGLANAEAVACGTPLLITDSESSRELWIDEKDALILPYDDRMVSFKMAIKHFSSYDFEPKNKFTISECISNYEKYMEEMMTKNDNI